MLRGASANASVDGRPVADFNRFITATGVYQLHLPKNNLFKSKQRNGTSAAYGYRLLLAGLSPGQHTIALGGDIPSVNYHIPVAYTLQVH